MQLLFTVIPQGLHSLTDTTHVFDSTYVKRYMPDSLSEKNVFSDPSLHYDIRTGEKQGLMDKFLAWLAEQLFGRAGHENIQSARDIVIWTIVIIAVILVIRLFFRSELSGLIKPKAKKTAFSFMDISGDLSEINFDRQIEEAVKAYDYRLAIRWHFLKALYLLDQKGLISFAPYKTNIDYYRELRDQKEQETFIELSRVYEYAWYGKHELTELSYQNDREKFNAIERSVNAKS